MILFPPFSFFLFQAVPRYDAALARGYLDAGKYRRTLHDSMFTLCPRGANAETRRVYEALEAGSIPIVEAAAVGPAAGGGAGAGGAAPQCADSLQPLKESGAPVIFVRNWANLPALLERETADRARLNRRQAALLSWYAGFKTKAVDAFERGLERAKADGGVGTGGGTVTGDPLAADDGGDGSGGGGGGGATPPATAADQRLKPFLVTGTARSGGPGIAAVLRRAGIDARFGGLGRHGAVSWAHAFSNRSIDVPFEMAEDRVRRMAPSFAFSPIVHVVRHPLDVVGDLYRHVIDPPPRFAIAGFYIISHDMCMCVCVYMRICA